MRLKRLELFGFKSFADRSALGFPQSLVGIVGPNGCGKSNVVDAVRWVLGEQRAKSMRGGEMIDVIFKGSTSRPALGVAEVTMVLDNSSGTIEERGDEVSVTRRVFKSGEGEYLLDGDRVRLKDVREMLFGTGLGSRGYAVLEQGKIDAVLSANPLERRGIFEEAAGISRYRQRKKEVESRLKRVGADVLRLDDVLGELAKRERSLKIQAGKAQRFLEAREAWRVDGLRYLRHKLSELRRDIAHRGNELTGLEERAEEHRRLRGVAEEDVRTRDNELEALVAEVARVSAEAAEEAAELRALDERRNQLAARINAWRHASEDEAVRSEELATKLAEREAEQAGLTQEKTDLDAEGEAMKTRLERLANELRTATENSRAAVRALETKNEEVLAAVSRRTSAENRTHHLKETATALEGRVERAHAKTSEAREGLEAAREAESRAQEEWAQRESSVDEMETERAERAEVFAQQERRWNELEVVGNELELEGARLASRIESLLDRERENESLEQGARAFLEDPEAREGFTSKIGGLAADVLRTDTRNARALDAVLGERARALVLLGENARADAARALAWLRREKRGRARFVLPSAVRPGAPARPEVVGEAGVEAPLAALCRATEGCEALADELLHDVYVARDLAAAQDLARRHAGARFVTLDGDLVGGPLIAGGHTEVAQGPVGRRAFAADLERERQAKASELETLRAERRELAGERERSRTVLERLREALEAATEERARARGVLETARARLEDLELALELCEREEIELREELARVRTALEEARADLESQKLSQIERERELAALEGQRTELEEVRERVAEDEGHARIEARGVFERAEALANRLRDLARTVDEVRFELERTRRLCREHREAAEAGEKENHELEERRVALLSRRGELEERLVELRQLERQGREAVEALRRRGDAITGELEVLLDDISKRRLSLQKRELARDDLERRSNEDFALTPEELLADFEPEEALATAEALAELEARVMELKRSLEKLGPVNLEAVEELDEVAERLNFLTTQRTDLESARRSLEGTLRTLNVESERLFLETFEEVRTNFQRIFRKLFGGGKADMSLADGEDVLEAGIEILARPPGREMLPITLLSGGQRTLTALAILFSVFQARPSPFCILDEVDAALDDANIGRFLSLIDEINTHTQFIIVTHNKGTMGACDMLYGVTMAVKGVSKVVSVELADVDDFVPQAAGKAQLPASAQESSQEADTEPTEEGEAVVVLTPQARRGTQGEADEDEVETEEALVSPPTADR